MPVWIEDDIQTEFPLNHARIGYRDVIESVSATSSAENAPASAAKSWQTYERWLPDSSPATITATFDEAPVSYIGLAAHTLSRASEATVEVEEGGAWVDISSNFDTNELAPDNEAIMLLMNERILTGVRVTVIYEGDAPSIGKIACGRVLVMDRPFYRGHSPAMLSRDTSRTPSISQGGEWLGTTVIRQGRSTSMSWSNIKADRYRMKVEPLVRHAQTKPFFVAWNAKQFTDCIYAMLQGDPRPDHSGPRDLMSVTFDLKVYSDGTDRRPL